MSAGRGPGEEVVAETEAWTRFELLRWGGPPPGCPRCGARGGCTLLRPRDGLSRATRTGTRTARRVWRCGTCRRQFSVLYATVFQSTRVPLRTWLAAWSDLVAATDLTGAATASRHGLTRESAAHVLDRLRDARAAAAAECSAAPPEDAGELARILALPPAAAAAVRARTPARRRHLRQRGPVDDYR